ncbi:ABC transporter ATP-binding protein [Methylopila sp. 73B]|uniref:ABC transporter ATP-binding protein n=1 Tax=Methylopila sp. 73B TaxID=1120792 RepID=UPI0003607E3D|nr:ABC transporter ATP-binding protein [Methylopila sp. 73B]
MVEAAAPLLQSLDLTLGYGDRPVVNGVDLTVPRGAFTALIGPNGSGKSTLLRGLCRLLRPTSGQVLLDGADIHRLPTRDVARRIGVLPQGPTAPEGLTVRELVAMGRYPHQSPLGRWSDADEAACRHAMELTGLEPLGERLLDTLSGGQRQRAWIAMALAQQTEALLLDEPTTFLDLAHQIEVLDLLTDLVIDRAATVVAVLHEINQAARYADHIVMLKDGAIHAEGAPEDVLTSDNVNAVFGLQNRIFLDPDTGSIFVAPLGARRRRLVCP